MTRCDMSCFVVHLRFYFANFKACQGPDDLFDIYIYIYIEYHSFKDLPWSERK